MVTSDTITQYDPALSEPESCAVLPAVAVVNAFASGVHPVIADVPTASPIVTVDSSVPPGSVSVAEVNVTLTEPPPCPTEKPFDAFCSTPFTGGGTVPVRMSVVIVCDGDVVDEVDDEEEDPLHAPAASTAASVNDRRTVDGIMA